MIYYRVILRFFVSFSRTNIVLLGFLFVFGAGSGFASEPEPSKFLHGRGIAKVSGTGDSVIYTAEFDFMIAENGRFAFSIYNHPHYSDRKLEFMYDGEDYYYIVPEDPIGYAYLSSDREGPPMMLFQDDVRDALWMVIGSGKFLRAAGTGEIVNLFARPRQSVAAYGFRYKSSLLNDVFPIPKEFSVYRDLSLDMPENKEELRLGLDLSNFGGTIRADQWKSRYNWGDQALAIELIWDKEDVLEGGIEVPMLVNVNSYRSLQVSGSSPSIWRRVELRFNSWRLETSGNVSFQPEINQRLDVMDSRLRQHGDLSYVDQVQYTIGDRPTDDVNWRPTSDVVIQERFSKEMRSRFLPKRSIKKNVIKTFVILFGILSIAFPTILYLRKS